MGQEAAHNRNPLAKANTQFINYLDSNKDGTLNGAVLGVGGGATALSAPWSSSTAGIPAVSAAAAYAEVVQALGSPGGAAAHLHTATTRAAR